MTCSDVFDLAEDALGYLNTLHKTEWNIISTFTEDIGKVLKYWNYDFNFF